MYQLAARMLSGEVDILVGSRRMADLGRRLSLTDPAAPEVATFVAIDSELDDLPMGAVRGRWAAEALAEADGRRDAYLGQIRALIENACRVILARES